MFKKAVQILAAAALVISVAAPANAALKDGRIKRFKLEATCTALTAVPTGVIGCYAHDTGAFWLWDVVGSGWVAVASGSGIIGTNGGIIDNETNDVWTFSETPSALETLLMTFTANLVTFSSDSAATIAFTPAVSFTGDVTLVGGVGALTTATASTSLLMTGSADNVAAGFDMGSTGSTDTFRIVTTDASPGVEVTGTTGQLALKVDAGKVVFDETLEVRGLLTPKVGTDDRPFTVAFDEGAAKGLSLLQHDGSVYDTTADVVNDLTYGGTTFIFETVTTAAGTVTPVADAGGLDIQGSSVGIADEWVMSTGQLGAVSREIIIGTTPAWKACATWKSTVVLQQAALYLEVTTPGVPVDFGSSDPNYTSYAAIGQLLDEIYISDNTTGPTDTTDNWANGEVYALCILGDGAGVITYLLNGSAPSNVDAHTLADGVPHIIRLQGLTVTGTTSKPIITLFKFEYQ